MLFSAKNKFLHPRNSFAAAWLVSLLATLLLLAACGDSPTPVLPTATPAPDYQLVTEPELFFTASVPSNWQRAVVEPATHVQYKQNGSEVLRIGFISRRVGKLTPDSQRVLEERVDGEKKKYPALKVDKGGGGTVTLVDTTISIDRLSYTNAEGVEELQYILQANNVRAERAYVIYAATPAKDNATFQAIFNYCFKNFSSTATEVPQVSGESGLADPTVLAANAGGIIRPANAREIKGRQLRLVEWQSPPLSASAKQPVVTGTFPYDYTWRLRPFLVPAITVPTTPLPGTTPLATPTKANANLPAPAAPALYLESPEVDRTTRQALMQFLVYRDTLPAAGPSVEEWRRFYEPISAALLDGPLKAYGATVTLGDVVLTNQLYRAPFTARDFAGQVQSRGIVLFSRSGPHAIVSVLSLSPKASTIQDLLDKYDADFQTIVKSLQVKFN